MPGVLFAPDSQKTKQFVIPAKAGVHLLLNVARKGKPKVKMDPGFRRDDEGTFEQCHFERSEKSVFLIARDFSLRSR